MELKAFLCAAALCGGVSGSAVAADAIRYVHGSASAAVDSRYLSYGFVDNRDPILTTSAALAFCERVTLGVEAVYDLTTYGRSAGYGNRGGRYTELHPFAGVSRAFAPEDVAWLPTTVELGVDYLYEYHPGADEDTQLWTLGLALPDLWFAPALSVERDVMRDGGTYLGVSIGHAFHLLGEGDETLVLSPGVTQGFGTRSRVHAYAPGADGNRLMDTLFQLSFTWRVCDNVELGAYAGYSDFLFSRRLRKEARAYEKTGRWNESWSIVTGLSVTLSF